jgi:long-subunit acyl-CoA synthetase (AMP-forming)
MKRTVLRMLDEAAAKWPSRSYALRKTDAGFVAVSFADARERSRDFAAWLLSAGYRKGDAAAILAEGSSSARRSRSGSTTRKRRRSAPRRTS